MSKKSILIRVLLIMVIAIVLRAPYASVSFFNVDEALIAVMADTILEGGMLYRDAWEHQTPLSYFIYASVFFIFGKNNMTAIHFVGIAWIVLTALMIYKLADYLYGDGKGVGFLAALFYVIFISTYESWDVLGVNTEILMMLFITAGVFYLLRAERTANPGCFILSGGLCALGAMTKQTGATVLPVLLTQVVLITLLQKKGLDWGSTITRCFLILLGFSLVVGAFIVYFWVHGALKDFFYLTIQHPYQYSTVVDLEYFKYRCKVRTVDIVIPNLLLWGMAAITTCYILLRNIRNGMVKDLRERWNEQGAGELLLVLWLGVALLALSFSGRFFGHYYIQAFPALSLLAAYGVLYLPVKLMKSDYVSPFYKLLIWMFVLIGILIPLIKYQKINLTRFIFQRDNPQLEYDKYEASFIPVADYIREHSALRDSIFVWGFCPQIYVLAHRKPSSRFIFCNFLTGCMTESSRHFDQDAETTDWITPGSWQMLQDDLRRNRPKFIIDTSPSDYLQYAKYPIKKYPYLKELIDQEYQLVTTISNMDIYRLQEDTHHSDMKTL